MSANSAGQAVRILCGGCFVFYRACVIVVFLCLTNQVENHKYSLSVFLLRHSTVWCVLPLSAAFGRNRQSGAANVFPVPFSQRRAYARQIGYKSVRFPCCTQNPLPVLPAAVFLRHSLCVSTHCPRLQASLAFSSRCRLCFP